MDKRLEGKVAIVTGAGQTLGDTIGNGRAISLLFARAGARVLLVDHRLDSAEETREMITQEGGEAFAFAGDVTRSDDCRRLAEACMKQWPDRYFGQRCRDRRGGPGAGQIERGRLGSHLHG